ncbi:MAG: transcriptional regulator [Anaerolineales bacterium]|nr:transcriptional regulator [Anaerolineales bacterium]|tara:strand:- start:21 stop:341 length:321 start_codon:yes stop_codon:yes gene_type:complete
MSELNSVIHQPIRLQIMSLVTSLDGEMHIEFTYLQKILQVTAGNLGAHLRKLEDEGFISIQKTFLSRKPHTYIETTPLGHQAFAEHVAALADILQQTPIINLDESN